MASGYGFIQKRHMRRDQEHGTSLARAPGADSRFEPDHILGLIIRWMASVNRSDWFTACFVGKLTDWPFELCNSVLSKNIVGLFPKTSNVSSCQISRRNNWLNMARPHHSVTDPKKHSASGTFWGVCTDAGAL